MIIPTPLVVALVLVGVLATVAGVAAVVTGVAEVEDGKFRYFLLLLSLGFQSHCIAQAFFSSSLVYDAQTTVREVIG